ncbi:MAG TPA: hypothetical protein VEU96_03950 [Bryobacteraceae bacterium]|nr:hypothetical protein [Bryobacteraceae bacterium]
MIIAETIIAVTLFATVPKKIHDWSELHYISDGKTASNCFEASSGVSLEHRLTEELQGIEGVGAVRVTQSGNSYFVSVVMDTYEFSNYEKVIQKEMELFDKHASFKFNFNVTFAEQAAVGSSASNVA